MKITSHENPPLIVCVGASAGGLEAFQELLNGLGKAPGFAIMFMQHLDPSSSALLFDLLDDKTGMDIVDLQGRKKLRADTIYVCPPQKLLELKNGFVNLVDGADERPTAPIDHLFHSIAEDQGERGIGVILSGAGTDGTLGLKAISDRGGLTFAQDAASAKYDSMPRSAATTGVADHVMPPREIAEELLMYIQHLTEQSSWPTLRPQHDDISEAIPVIAEILMAATNHNFQHYKIDTLSRRIQRRMQILKIGRVGDYVDHLQHHEDETQALFRELLIGVTTFFRDPKAFASLKHQVLPKLFEQRSAGDTIRMWVAGCANGAEAYTLAILCREVMDQIESPADVQIFASDIDERALKIARAGSYPIGIEEYVSPSRLKRFFVKRGKHYQVTQEIRDLVLFSAHNLISDPPFSRQDLITCRNLLIYLGPHLQNKLIPLFHYALRPGGFLLLGPSENITAHAELFRTVDAKQRISQRKGMTARTMPSLSLRQPQTIAHGQAESVSEHTVDLTAIAQRIVLDEFTPKYAVIDESGQILNSSADLEKYVHFQGGDYQNNLVKMVHSGLRIGLRSTLGEARKTARRVQHDNLSIRLGDKIQRVMLTVQPMPRLGEDEPLFMVVFHDIGMPFVREKADRLAVQMSQDGNSLIAQMELELETTRRDLDKTMQDMEAANEELKSSNEELLSMNEELMSANEELETSKEEIRAGSDAVARANDDLENLLRSTQIATVFLDDELNIRSFTPAIGEIYALISTDVGRPLERFMPSVQEMPPLPNPKSFREGDQEDTVVADSGKSYIRRVLPYQSHTGDTDGIVVTFTDVSELRESEQQFRGTFENAAVGIAHVGLSGQWLRVNDRLCSIVGYSREELLAGKFHNITHPDDLNSDLEQMQRLVDGEIDTYAMEKRYLQPSGKSVWINLTVSLVRDAGKKPDYAISVVEDIDDKVRNREALIEHRNQLRLALSAGKMGSWSLDPASGELDWDESNHHFFGSDPSIPMTRDKALELVHPEDVPGIQSRLEESVRELTDFDHEFRVFCPCVADGSLQVRWLASRGKVVTNDVGQPIRLIGVNWDITERREIERRVNDHSKRLAMALKAGDMAAWEWTPNGSIWTDEVYEMLGIASDQAASPELFFSCVHPEDLDELKAAWDRATGGGDAYNCEFRIVRPDGEIRWMVAVGEVVRNEQGRVISVYGTNWDSTDEHLTAERLRDSERAAVAASESKSAFVANMSHEIRTPMTAILGYADLIAEHLHSPEAIEHLHTIQRNGRYLLEIINDILDLSKIEAGKLDVEAERFQPNRVIEDVLSFMEVRARSNGLQLAVEYDGKLPLMIESDAKRLKQILINLVGNAIKFTREGRVSIRVRYAADRMSSAGKNQTATSGPGKLMFDVIDTGIGMSDEQQANLFKPFSQGDSSVSRHFGGTGLGLAISQRLAETLGGQITASSTLGVGSTFTVTIGTGDMQNIELVDYASAESRSRTRQRLDDRPRPSSDCGNDSLRSRHILIVDDRRDIRFLTRKLLTKAGATVDECEDGQLAVDHVADCRVRGRFPDLILLDMQMPNLDGYKTARALRNLGFTNPIIALTADAMQGDMNECIEAGCNDYLSKPIDAVRLVQLVGRLTGAKQDE